MSVREKLAECGLSIHDAFPGYEFVGPDVIGGFSEKVAAICTSVPLGVGFGFKMTFDLKVDGISGDLGDCASESALFDVFGPPC